MKSKANFFWLSYTDLMISLFFVMLILYVLTLASLNIEKEKAEIDAEKYKKIQEIEQAIASLDTTYFNYNPSTKRFKMNVDVQFKSNRSNIYELDRTTQSKLKQAGKALYDLISSETEKRKKEGINVEYLLVIEGTAYKPKKRKLKDDGYSISFQRALAVFNFWKNEKLNFYKLENCESLIAGSGIFGKSRESDEEKNMRFTIQITPKVGDLKN